MPLPCRGILIRGRAGFSVPARFLAVGRLICVSRPRFGFRVLEFSGYPPAPRPPTQQFNGFFWKKLGGCFIGFSRSLAGAGIWRCPVASHHARDDFGAGNTGRGLALRGWRISVRQPVGLLRRLAGKRSLPSLWACSEKDALSVRPVWNIGVWVCPPFGCHRSLPGASRRACRSTRRAVKPCPLSKWERNSLHQPPGGDLARLPTPPQQYLDK